MTGQQPDQVWTVTPVLVNGWPEATLSASVASDNAHDAAQAAAERDGAPPDAVYAVVDNAHGRLQLHQVTVRGIRAVPAGAVAACPPSFLSDTAALSARRRLDLGFPTRPRSRRLVADLTILGMVGLLPVLLSSGGRLADHRLAYVAGVAAALTITAAILTRVADWFTLRIQRFAGEMRRDPAHHARLIRLATGRPRTRP